MSSSGWKEEIYNPSERALSSDLMRMQRFKGADAAEIWRKQIQDTRGTDDSLAGGGALPLTITTTAPVSAEVHGGLLVRPQNGSLSLFVDDGIVTLIDPDSPENPDESIYKFVRDPGISVLGTLLMTANPAGSIRIDIIECARTGSPDLILETDNRDIFNPITGLFAPATVSKVSAGRLQYRVRAGVAGAGFPGLVAGWLPLAVVSNPPASTTNDDMTFWDVRPLISDRVWAPFKNAYTNPRLRRNYISIDRTAVAGKAFLIGQVDASVHFANNGVDVGWYRLGGTMNRGTPGTDGTCDLNDAANQSGALASPCYVYLLEPYGLPRWARYLDSIAGTRVPRSPRGIPVVTTIAPVALTNAPSAPISPPASTGLITGTLGAVCIGCTGFAAGTVLGLQTNEEGDQWTEGVIGLLGPFGAAQTVAGTIAGTVSKWTLTPGTNFPVIAKALRISMTFTATVATGVDSALAPLLTLKNTGTGIAAYCTFALGTSTQRNDSGINQAFEWTYSVKIPVSPAMMANGAFDVSVDTLSFGATLTAGSLNIAGWDV